MWEPNNQTWSTKPNRTKPYQKIFEQPISNQTKLIPGRRLRSKCHAVAQILKVPDEEYCMNSTIVCDNTFLSSAQCLLGVRF